MRAKNAENLTEGIVVSKMDGLFEPRKYNNERYVDCVSDDRVSGNHIQGVLALCYFWDLEKIRISQKSH